MNSIQPNRPLTILLADDDTDDCIFFQSAVDEFAMPCKITIVNDGEQLMHFLNKESNGLPDVLFLDINMPRKNGFECLEEIKLSEKLKSLIVIMFSTSLEQEVVNQLYNSGAKYFVRKPSEFSQFKKIIQQTLVLISKGNTPQPTRENFVLTLNEEPANKEN